MMSRLPRRLLLALAALNGGHHLRTSAWRTSGELPTESRFATYVGKFCFDFTPGPNKEAGLFELLLKGEVAEGPTPPEGYDAASTDGKMFVLVYDDEAEHWQKVRQHWDSPSCEELVADASFAMPISPLSGLLNRSILVHEKIRPRLWYFVLANCGAQVLSPVVYEVHGENILQGFQSEFGMDERGTLPLQLLSSVAFFSIAGTLRYLGRRCTGTEAMRSRPLLRLLLLSAGFSAAGASFLAFHYVVYMANGYGLTSVEVFGQLCICAAKALLTVLQLLTAKGWALFYAPEELAQRRFMLISLGAIVLISIACEIHADYFHDMSTALYLYESWPGTVILLLNVLLFVEAWRSMTATYRHETSDEVRLFYLLVSIASLLYFLTLPVTCVLAVLFSPWVRAKYVARAEVISRFVATLLLAYCLRPSRLDAMVSARLEEGLEPLGELQEEAPSSPFDGDHAQTLARKPFAQAGYRDASEDVADRLAGAVGEDAAE